MTSRRWFLRGLEVLSPVVLLAAWWLLSADSSSIFFPPLSAILDRFRELWLFAQFRSDMVPSLVNLAAGFLGASVVGIGLGMAMALQPRLRQVGEPIVYFVNAVPPVAFIPLLIGLIGFGRGMKLTSIMLAAFAPTMISTLDGLLAVDSTLTDVAKVYRLTFRERVLRVYLPSALPQVLAGMQLSLQVAFIVMVASEMLGEAIGIGAETIIAQQSFLITDMWAGMILLGILGFLANTLFDWTRRRSLHWYYGARAQARAE